MRRPNPYPQFRLSDLARDPVVKAFFRRGESDDDAAYAIPQPRPVLLTGGAFVGGLA